MVVTVGLNKLLSDALNATGGTRFVGLIGPLVSNGAMTASSAVLTSASNPFVAGDVGSDIVVKGAGAAGVDLLTTVASYQSAGQVTLTVAASTTVSNAIVAVEPKAADTMASHADFVEATAYSETTRQAFVPGTIAAGSVDNSASKATFTASGALNVAGYFVATSSTKSEAASTLIGGMLFAEGIKQLTTGETLSVTVTLADTAT